MQTLEQEIFKEYYKKLCFKLIAEAERTGDMIPFVPIRGKYKDLMIPGGIYWWCNGFYPGILWQMYYATGEEIYRENAAKINKRLEEILNTPEKLDHDVGFMILPSLYSEMLLEKDQQKKEVLKKKVIKAADMLKARKTRLGFLEAWNQGTLKDVDVSGMMIADTMMNLSLLFIASELTEDGAYADIAISHADMALKYLLRKDGTANHIVQFDLDTGDFLGARPGQGYSPDSMWTRGQGWVLYGFMNAYIHTREERYLTAAIHLADICVLELEKRSYEMPVDFMAPATDGRYDASAATIIASGLISLSDYIDGTEGEILLNAAKRLLKTTVDKYADWDVQTDGIIAGCANRYHDDRMYGMKIIFADYFFVEAVLKLQKKALFIW